MSACFGTPTENTSNNWNFHLPHRNCFRHCAITQAS